MWAGDADHGALVAPAGSNGQKSLGLVRRKRGDRRRIKLVDLRNAGTGISGRSDVPGVLGGADHSAVWKPIAAGGAGRSRCSDGELLYPADGGEHCDRKRRETDSRYQREMGGCGDVRRRISAGVGMEEQSLVA